MTTIYVIYGLTFSFLLYSLSKSKEKTIKGFKKGLMALNKSLPGLLAVIGIVGLTLGVLSPEVIERFLGEQAGLVATFGAAIVGAITLIPSLIAYPLAASLLRSGATVATISAFITTLVMVGFVTAPMEIKELGKKFTIVRNALGFIAALIIGAIMGAIL
jgi:uncharacterized membrane protein YraQ (UPF0718 family)